MYPTSLPAARRFFRKHMENRNALTAFICLFGKEYNLVYLPFNTPYGKVIDGFTVVEYLDRKNEF